MLRPRFIGVRTDEAGSGGDREALRVRFVVVEARAREASTNGCLVPLGDGD